MILKRVTDLGSPDPDPQHWQQSWSTTLTVPICISKAQIRMIAVLSRLQYHTYLPQGYLVTCHVRNQLWFLGIRGNDANSLCVKKCINDIQVSATSRLWPQIRTCHVTYYITWKNTFFASFSLNTWHLPFLLHVNLFELNAAILRRPLLAVQP